MSPRLLITIPTYWTSAASEERQDGAAIYDHPTPIDQPNTLSCCLESLATCDSTGPIDVVLVVSGTTSSVDGAAEARVRELAASAPDALRVACLGPSLLPLLHEVMRRDRLDTSWAAFRGYGHVRNLQLLAGIAVGADGNVFLDDDEVVPPEYLARAATPIPPAATNGNAGCVVSGPYINDSGSYRFSTTNEETGNAFLDKAYWIHRAIEELMSADSESAATPVGFGGNLVIDRRLAKTVPFDPWIPRGEDIDYIVTARSLGYRAVFDRRLQVVHRPPEAHRTPACLLLQADVARFLHQREKLRIGRSERGWLSFDTDPYPGRFLCDDLEEQGAAALRATCESSFDAEGRVADLDRQAKSSVPRSFELLESWPQVVESLREPLRETITQMWGPSPGGSR